MNCVTVCHCLSLVIARAHVPSTVTALMENVIASWDFTAMIAAKVSLKSDNVIGRDRALCEILV